MTDVAATIAALDAQRAVLGDAVVDAAIAALRAQDGPAVDRPGPATTRRARRAGPVDGDAPAGDAGAALAPGADHAPDDPTRDAAPAAGERRLVTILFADIVGSTTLAEQADPEDVAAIVEGAFGVMTGAIDDHGGRVGRLMGDGMIAFFGAPVGHEDDPLRAVRAACAIRDGIAAYGRDLAARGGPAVQVRVGVHTGRALVGRVGGARHGEYTVIGDAANTAARLEANAPHGQVLISEATARLVRGAVPLEAHGALALKGKREPVETHVVRGAPEAAVVPRGLGTTALVGRERELDALRALAAEALDGRGQRQETADDARAHASRPGQANPPVPSDPYDPYDLSDRSAPSHPPHRPSPAPEPARPGARIALIEAEAGLGKTRLVAELRAALEAERPGARWLDATAEAARAGEPYAVLRDLVARGCGLREADGEDIARAVLAARLTAVFAAESPDGAAGASEAAAIDAALAGRDIAALLGLDRSAPGGGLGAEAARAARDRALAAIGRWLAAEGRAAGGAVVALDDLHWADEASRAALAPVFAACAEAPVLFVLATRPGTPLAGELGVAPAEEGGQALGQAPDSRDGVGTVQVVRFVLHPLDAAAQRALLDDLARALPDGLDAALRRRIEARAEGNPYYAEELVRMLRDGSGALDDLPPTLAGLLQARIDGLPGGERGALRRAAVVGRVFWDEAVAELAAGEPAEATAGLDLDALERRSLVAARARSDFAGAREYAFAHALLRDAAYGNLLLAARRTLHARVAAWLAARAGDRADVHAGSIASHHAAAGDAQAAASWYLRAARRAADVFANADARAACDAGLAALDGPGSDRPAETARSTAQEGAGPADGGDRAQPADVEESRQAATADDRDRPAPDALRADLLALRCAIDDRLGDRAAQRDGIAALRAVADRIGPVAMARALDAEADLLWATADFDGARRAAEAGLAALAAETTPAGRPVPSATAAGGGDDASTTGPTRVEPLLEGLLRRNVGRAARERADYAAARAAFEAAAACFEAAGARRAGADALVQIGALDSELGDFAAARTVLERALAAAAEPEALPERAWALDNLAIVHACLGELDAALRRGEEALALARRFGGRRRELSNRINLSAIAALLGRYDEAQGHAGRAAELALAVDDPSGAALARFALAEAARASGDGAGAVAHAEAGRAAAAGQGRAFLDALGEYALAGALLGRDAHGDAAAALAAAGRCVTAAEAAGLTSYRVVGMARGVEALGRLGRTAEAAAAARDTAAALREAGGVEEPEQLVHLAVHRALAAVGDGGADAALRAAGRAVLAQARRIGDPGARRAFLDGVAINREVREVLAERAAARRGRPATA